jgi:nucleoside-diphosphate-sugar epimerase
MERIIITGATGLIGSHVAEYFTEHGVNVTCMVRKNSNLDFVRSIRANIVYGDITDLEVLQNVFASRFNFIIHTAAFVGDWGKHDDFYKINVTGSLNVLKAARYNKINDVIITGSISCYGEESSQQIKDETCTYNSHYKYFLDPLFPSGMNNYRDSKAEAIKIATAYAKSNSMNLTVLHPAWVYGEREFHSGFYDFLKTMKGGFRFAPGSRKNKFHTIYARDLAKVYYLAYQKKLDGINELLAVSPAAEYQHKIIEMLCQKAGYKTPMLIPKSLMYSPAFIVEFIYSLLQLKNAPIISRARLNIFYDNIEYSSKKLFEELGFTPDYSLEDSIERTVKWYKENNYL